MPKKTAKKPKFNNDPLGELSNKVKEIKPQKDICRAGALQISLASECCY